MRAINILGSKVSNAHRYPPPRYGTIVEPFAGGAGYSLRYADRMVILCDVRPAVVGVWRYLIATDPREILELPIPSKGQLVEDLDCSDGGKLLISWCVNQSVSPKRQGSGFMYSPRNANNASFWGPRRRARTAELAARVKHWFVHHGSCFDLPDFEATWFIDPPYADIPTAYGTPALDYARLAEWCRSRKGQTIVCERSTAKWLPFMPLYSAPRTGGKTHGGDTHCHEGVWIQ